MCPDSMTKGLSCQNGCTCSLPFTHIERERIRPISLRNSQNHVFLVSVKKSTLHWAPACLVYRVHTFFSCSCSRVSFSVYLIGEHCRLHVTRALYMFV